MLIIVYFDSIKVWCFATFWNFSKRIGWCQVIKHRTSCVVYRGVHCCSWHRCKETKIFIKMTIFCCYRAFKFSGDTTPSSSWILSKVWVDKFDLHFFLLGINDKASSKTLILLKESISKLNLSILFTKWYKQWSLVEFVIGTVNQVKYDSLNNIFRSIRWFDDSKHMGCIKLTEVINLDCIWNLVEDIHQLSLSPAGDVFKVNISHFDIIRDWSWKVRFKHENHATVVVIKISKSYVFKICCF